MRGGAFLKGKEGRVGFRRSLKVQGRTGGFSKDPSLMGKSGANERNESSLSNCRVQPALSKKEGRVDFRKNLRFKGGRVGFRRSLKVQGRTGGFSKDPSLMGKSCANERNESSLSNCRVQPALSKKEGELQKDSVWAKFAYTASDGKTYLVDYYNLDVIISVGNGVTSLMIVGSL